MPRLQRRDQEELRREHGLLTARRRTVWRHWRDPYLLALSLAWPAFVGLIAGTYLALNLLFAGLYWLEPTGLGGTAGPRTSLAEAFFFSVQTLGSIGYGVLHPLGLYTNLVVTAESLTGLLFVAISTGAAFARFARSTARIRFSQLAVVHSYNSLPTLSFRLANERGTSLRDPRLRAYLAMDEVSQEGHCMRRLRPLPLEREKGVALLLVWTAMHRIDANSPLRGLDHTALERLNAELVVAFSGIDATLERPLHAEASWPADRIRFGACVADMVSPPENGGERRIDWSAFDLIRPCP